MSSSPPPERQHTQQSQSRRPLTLRAKLIIGIVVLITAVCAVVGVTSEIFLNRYLIAQVDKQVLLQQSFARNGGPDRPRGEDIPFGCGDTNGRYGPAQGLNSLTA